MSSSGNNQSNNETPAFPMHAATFQVAVTAAMIVVLANRSATNANKTDKGVDNSDRGNNPRNQQIVTIANTQNNNSKFKK